MPGPKILGQITGTGIGTNVLVYTSPTTTGAGGSAISAIVLTNTSSGVQNGNISVVPSATTTPTTIHLLIPTSVVNTQDILALQLGVSLAPGDKIYAAADTGMNVHVYGTEL